MILLLVHDCFSGHAERQCEEQYHSEALAFAQSRIGQFLHTKKDLRFIFVE